MTLLFTDIEGSTQLWESHPEEMRVALERHDALLREEIESAGGYVFKTVGDAFCATFSTSHEALDAVVALQRAMRVESWPAPLALRVRAGIHTGVCSERDGDYFGPTVNRAARLVATAHGGQSVMSAAAAENASDGLPDAVTLHDLGEHRLKDLARPERIFQLDIDGLTADFPPLRSLSSSLLQHNLPIEASTFIGREQELEELRGLLGSSRLVTLVGVGGAGKTRLALHVAAELLDGTGDGVWLVDLAPLADANLLVPTIANVLGMREDPARPPLEMLVEVIGARRLLLILDNCEHMVDRVAGVASTLLASCPNVELVATSREPLAISGEQVYRVPPLGVPGERVSDLDTLADSESVRLFMDRAGRQKPDLLLDATNATTIARICRRLDGLPLAIELAAVRLSSLSPSDLDVRLDERFAVLRSTARDVLPRQRTLEALIDWSWELLSAPERSVLTRLSVFSGSFDLLAAEAVNEAGGLERSEVYDRLASLVDKSLVQLDDTDGTTRYRLLETVREYSAVKLLEAGATEATASLHRDHYLDLAEAASPHCSQRDARIWLDRLDDDNDNLRAAMATCLHDRDTTPGLRLSVALRRFWSLRGYSHEGIEATTALLEGSSAEEPTRLRAMALNAAAYLTFSVGDYAAVERRAGEAIAIARSLDDQETVCEALWNLTWASRCKGAPRAALSFLEEAFALAQPLGNLDLHAGLLFLRASVLRDLGDAEGERSDNEESLRLFRQVGDLARVAEIEANLADSAIARRALTTALAHLAEALTLSRDLGDHETVIRSTLSLGLVEYLDGDPLRARTLFLEALASASRLGYSVNAAFAVLGLALAELPLGDAARSALLHGAADARFEQLGHAIESTEAELRDDDHLRLRAVMGDKAFVQAYQEGHRMQFEEVEGLLA